jgi:hypothetical protein
MNQMYDKSRQAFLRGQVNWESDDIRAILVDTAQYAIDITLHDFLDDIPAGARVSSAQLVNRTVVDGIRDADDTQFLLVSGPTVEAIVIYKHTGVESTSQLIDYIDTGAGLPFTPNGGNLFVRWDNGANKIANWVNV